MQLLVVSLCVLASIILHSANAAPASGHGHGHNNVRHSPKHPFHPQWCKVDGEVDIMDPCRPYCICKEGKLICGEIICSDKFEPPHPKDRCEKIHVKGRCCHHYICIHENGTATMVYPEPELNLPDELYEDRRR